MKRILIIIIAIFAIITFLISELGATPELSLWTGNRCSTCHINMQGGGMRNDFGWNFNRDASTYFPRESYFFKHIDKKDYSYLDGLFAFGTDFRMQTARSHKYENAKRKVFPMQATIYANSNPFDWLILEGQYNLGPKIFQGQTIWGASLILKPADYLPVLRIGHFQPSFGIRDCDMTSFDRRTVVPDGSEILIAPDFAEYGVELIYEGLDWFTAEIGMFDSRNFREVSVFGDQVPVVLLPGNLSFNARLIIYPSQIIEELPDMYIGGSTFINGTFIYNSGFMGFSPYEDFSIYFRYFGSNKPYTRLTNNYIFGANYLLYKGVIVGLRGEMGNSLLLYDKSDNRFLLDIKGYQIVANAKLYPLPYISLIPEYRFYQSEEYNSGRWALQLHLYY